MFRLWGKLYKDNILVQDMVIENDSKGVSKQDKTHQALEEVCYALDIQLPIWLNDNKKDFPLYNKTLFHQDHFIEDISFDYLEIEIIEEDKD